MVRPLMFLLDHPDNRVRLGAARSLVQLCRKCGEDVFVEDVVHARNAYEDARERIIEGVAVRPDDQEFLQLMSTFFDIFDGNKAPANYATGEGDPAAVFLCPDSFPNQRGMIVVEFRVEEGNEVSKVTKDAILKAVVGISGVVSSSFDGSDRQLLIHTRSETIASDPVFQADVIATVEEQLPKNLKGVSVTGYNAGDDDSDESDDGLYGSTLLPLYLDTRHATPPSTPTPISPRGLAGFDKLSLVSDNLRYIDEMDTLKTDRSTQDECGNSPYLAGHPDLDRNMIDEKLMADASDPAARAYCFFAPVSRFKVWQKVAEFEEDPTVVARLRKARLREEAKLSEERSRIGRLLSILTRSK